MKQTRTILPVYSADAFGVCSALYELGGLLVMHDASGCNSTYSTHDEPRWYHSQSLVFVSGLTETDAIMGNDEKLKKDLLSAIHDLHPSFVALAGTPIPMMIGCDLEALTREIQKETAIPCFGFQTNGMRSYLSGSSDALAAFAERMTDGAANKRAGTINILGATPQDFSVSGTVESIKQILRNDGWEVLSTWAMGSTLQNLARAGEAEVNLVISGTGMKAAHVLNKKFGTPWVAGTPIGPLFTRKILKLLRDSAGDGRNRIAFSDATPQKEGNVLIIGESLISRSLAAAIGSECGFTPQVLCPLEQPPEWNGILSAEDLQATEEEDILAACSHVKTVIADPLYRFLLPPDHHLIPIPHEALSGRMYRKQIPDYTKLDMNKIGDEITK